MFVWVESVLPKEKPDLCFLGRGRAQTIETTWRTMRWATAKLDELKTQVEEVREALLACSGAQETEVGRSLLQRLSDHTTSLEVTAALRQPAVQPRHWQHLVTVAGWGARIS